MEQLIFKNKTLLWTERLFLISLCIFPFLWGLFYDYTACFSGVFLCGLFIAHISITKKITWEFNRKTISFLGILAGYLIACFFAIDRGMTCLGLGKILTMVVFYVFTLQLRNEVKEIGIQTVVDTGVIMVVLCVIAYVIPEFTDFVFQARRMGGFFQYSNTFAFFLLMGIVLVLAKDVYTKTDFIKIVLLLLGLFWSGSRSVFLLFVVSIFILILKKTTHRRQILAIGISAIVFVILYTVITGDVQNIGRIFTTSLQSSTLLGRILYYIDAVKMLSAHSMGLGTMGYFYLQPAEQSGAYTTMFVHNDILQIGLDGGIIAMISFLIWMGSNLLDKNLSKRNQGLLLLFLLHICVDFDLQYTYLFFLLILLTSQIHQDEVEHEEGGILNDKCLLFVEKKYLKCGITLLGICSVLLFYLGMANMAEETGNHTWAIKLYPWNTESNISLMLTSENIEEVEQYADRILEQNAYSYEAYNMKAIAAFEKGNYKDMIAYKKKALAITKYEIAEYQDYIVMLKKAIDDSISRNDSEDYAVYVQELLDVPTQIEAVKEQTHELAWKLRDIPKLTLEQEYMDYIEWYRRLTNE